MSLTIKEVNLAHDALVNLVKNDAEQKYNIPVAARLVLADNLNIIIPVVESFLKVHNALVQKYGTKQANGAMDVTDPTKREAFFLERQNEENQDSGIEAFGSITVADLGDGWMAVDLLALLIKTGMLKK
jgi:hypothetical protein